MRMDKPQLHVTTRTNPPNVRKKPGTKAHTVYIILFLQRMKASKTKQEMPPEAGAGSPRAGVGWGGGEGLRVAEAIV